MWYKNDLGYLPQKKDTKMCTTNKDYMVGGSFFATYADAEKAAKTYASKHMTDYPIFGKLAVARCPIPDITVDKVTLAS